MKGYVYILKDDAGRNYIGSSQDVANRLRRHLSGYVHTTRRMKNPRIVF